MNSGHLTLPEHHPTRLEPSKAGRRFGYFLAVLINAGMLYVANNVLGWDVLPFLTDSFEEVLPIINVSLAATMAVNAAYIFFDHQWFKSLTQVGVAGISMAATVRFFRVFPFDFTEYDFSWETLVRAILIIAMVGIGIAIIVETAKLIRALTRI